MSSVKNLGGKEMVLCRICGEEKPREEFFHVINFTKFKKHKVIWCRACQKMWMQMRGEKERLKKFLDTEQKFCVTFE